MSADESTKPSTSSQDLSKPEDWPRVFEQHLNAGDLDAVMTLYEPEAHFATKSREILIGHDAIRKVLGEMIDAKTQMHSQAVRTITVGGVAQLYTDFEGTTTDKSGKRVPLQNKAIEVLRRQPDGSWKLERTRMTPAPTKFG
jgi:uncharacterized protein (TIGR02246 family)